MLLLTEAKFAKNKMLRVWRGRWSGNRLKLVSVYITKGLPLNWYYVRLLSVVRLRFHFKDEFLIYKIIGKIDVVGTKKMILHFPLYLFFSSGNEQADENN